MQSFRKNFMLFSFFSQHHRIHAGEKPMEIFIAEKALNIALMLLYQRTHTGKTPVYVINMDQPSGGVLTFSTQEDSY